MPIFDINTIFVIRIPLLVEFSANVDYAEAEAMKRKQPKLIDLGSAIDQTKGAHPGALDMPTSAGNYRPPPPPCPGGGAPPCPPPTPDPPAPPGN